MPRHRGSLLQDTEFGRERRVAFYRNLSIAQKQIVWAWCFLAVPTVFYVVVRFYPTANAILVSFQDWNLLGARTWTGIDNYVKLFLSLIHI